MFFVSYKTLKFSICLAIVLLGQPAIIHSQSIDTKIDEGNSSYKNPLSSLHLLGLSFGIIALSLLIKGHQKLRETLPTPTERVFMALRGITREDIKQAKQSDTQKGLSCIGVSLASFIISYCCLYGASTINSDK